MTMTAGANVVSEAATPSEPTVLAAWTATVVRALDARGIDGRALAAAAGIDPAVFATDDARIPLARTTQLWRLAVDATGDACFGIEVSRYVRPTTFNALSVGIIASCSLLDALDRIVRFASVVLTTTVQSPGLTHEDGTYVYTSTSLPGAPEPSHEAMEAILASIVRGARFLVDRGISPCEVWLRRPDPPPSTRFETFFDCPVRYGAPHYRLAYDAAVVDRPIPGGCAAVARTADLLATDYLERVRCIGRLSDRVRDIVAGLVDGHDVTPEMVAARLAMSSRTMQRYLQQEGTTFRDLAGDARIARAKQLIATEGLAAEQLAHRLGFSDPAAFRRAFKRRTGMTVGAYAAKRAR